MEGSRFEASVDETRRLLGEIDGIQQRTREDFRDSSWQWMAIWAVVCCGASISAFTPLAGWYWIVAAPVGIVVTVLVGFRADQRIRVRRKIWPPMAVGAVIGLANTVLSFRLGEEAIVVAVWVVLGLGFAAISAWDRVPSAPAAFSLLSIATLVVGVAVPDRFTLYPVIGVAFAAVLGSFSFVTRRGVPA